MKLVRRMLVVAVILSALGTVHAHATDTIVLSGATAQGQSGWLNLPNSIGGAPTDPVRSCLWSQGNCVTSMTLSGQGHLSVTMAGSVVFEPVAGFSGTTRSVTWQIATSDEANVLTGSLSFTSAPPPTVGNLAVTGRYNASVTIPIAASAGAGATIEWNSACLSEDASLSGGCTTEVPVTNVGLFWLDRVAHEIDFIPDTTFIGTPTQPPVLVLADSLAQTTITPIVPTTQAPPHLAAGAKIDSWGASGKSQSFTPLPRAGTGGVLNEALTCLVRSTGECTNELAVTGQGTFSLAPGALVTFTPTAAWTGDSKVIEVRICDVLDSCVEAEIQAHVATPVPAPELMGSTLVETPASISMESDAGATGAGSFVASTTRLLDPSSGEFQLTARTPEGVWTVDSETGRVRFTPAKGFIGNAHIRYMVANQLGEQVVGTMRFEVQAAPTSPQFSSTPATPAGNEPSLPPGVTPVVPVAPAPDLAGPVPSAVQHGGFLGTPAVVVLVGVLLLGGAGWYLMAARRRREVEEVVEDSV